MPAHIATFHCAIFNLLFTDIHSQVTNTSLIISHRSCMSYSKCLYVRLNVLVVQNVLFIIEFTKSFLELLYLDLGMLGENLM